MVLGVDTSRKLWLFAAPSSSGSQVLPEGLKPPKKQDTKYQYLKPHEESQECLCSAASIRNKFYSFSQRGSAQRSAAIAVSYFSCGGSPTLRDYIMQFNRGMQGYLFQPQILEQYSARCLIYSWQTCVHEQGDRETPSWLYVTAAAFVLPVNLGVSKSWLLLEWENSDE